jgi:hypothetical protein
MASRFSRSSTEHFDMLPFIGLLMCVLGVLLFVTLSVAALAVGPNVREGWLPVDNPGRKKVPILVEWDGSTAIIHKANQLTPVSAFSDTKFSATPEFRAFVDEMVGKRNTHYVIFAVRPSGFGSLQTLADEFRDKRVDVGYEPIPQDKAVRLLKGAL